MCVRAGAAGVHLSRCVCVVCLSLRARVRVCVRESVCACGRCRCSSLSCSLQAADLSKPIDKRIYKGTQPTCHDFNHLTATAESVSLLVGFSAGQVQLIDPIKKETSKLFNEEVSVGGLWEIHIYHLP